MKEDRGLASRYHMINVCYLFYVSNANIRLHSHKDAIIDNSQVHQILWFKLSISTLNTHSPLRFDSQHRVEAYKEKPHTALLADFYSFHY